VKFTEHVGGGGASYKSSGTFVPQRKIQGLKFVFSIRFQYFRHISGTVVMTDDGLAEDFIPLCQRRSCPWRQGFVCNFLCVVSLILLPIQFWYT
jgi:hypothetical protein